MSARKILTACLFSLACCMPIQAQVYSGNLTFVQATSSLSFGGILLGTPFIQQGAGSLTTTYTGTISVTVDLGANTIVFNSASAVADISGNWSPIWNGSSITLGTAPANYGIAHTATATTGAVRTTSITVSSPALPLTGGPGSFNFASTQTLAYLPGGFLDLSSGLFGNSHGVLSGSGPNTAVSNGTLVDLGSGLFNLAVPIISTSNIVNAGNVIGFTQLTGTLNATGTLELVAVPEPTTYALIGLSLGAAGYFSFRNKKRAKQLLDAKI